MKKRHLLLTAVTAALIGGLTAIGGIAYWGNSDDQSYDQPAATETAGRQNIQFANLPATNAQGLPSDSDLNFVDAAKATTPGVVHIKTFYETSGGGQMVDPLEEFFGFRRRRQGPPQRAEASGSGVIITTDGYIATNNHVVENADEVEVTLHDNRQFRAKVIGTDPRTDMALIKIDAENLSAIPYGDSDASQVGEWVLAVGNPFNLTSTVTAGIISAKGRNINILRNEEYGIESFIQTDAAVNPGNSGGALVNLRGELIGINSAIASPNGAYAGYSFAVPVTIVKKVMSDLKEYGVVQRAILGVQIRTINAELAKEHDLDTYSGVYVAGVQEASAAEKGGIEKGDVITAVDQHKVTSVAELQEAIAQYKPGDKVQLTYLRGSKKSKATVTLQNFFGKTTAVKNPEGETFDFNGASFADISQKMAQKLNIKGGAQIVKLGDGIWKKAGMQKGFIITGIDRQPIDNIQDLASTLRYVQRARGGILIEGVYPNGQTAYYGIGTK
ncbi:serine protease [Fulvitalea axinellae]|uniref:Serine protease n=1 Tax=Fulvitalea axinellae TaxID=1182444 RepID=A0AAU9CS99_9BACT|nr:serine protease [Fulvitalea axinellae]